MTPVFVSFQDGEPKLDWIQLTQALAAGHRLPKAEIEDTFLYRGSDTMLSRASWIDGLGLAVKTATIFPDNSAVDKPKVNGAVSLFDDADGCLSAMIDFHLVTKWKTAGDSLLAALRLANPASQKILILGAGTVASSLIQAFSAGFAQAEFTIWNRNSKRATDLARQVKGVAVATDLKAAVQDADIILGATMSPDPLIKGDWLRPGQHVNLIGAYRPDMREADDTAMARAKLYVDSRDTTLEHIGELIAPLASGAIQPSDVLADYYQLDNFAPFDPTQITVFKNGGGAHMDLMTARYILDQVAPA